MNFIVVTLLVFQFDISGNDIKDEQPRNISFKLVILIVFQSDISGKDIKDEQNWNMLPAFEILLIPVNFISNVLFDLFSIFSIFIYSVKLCTLLSYIILQWSLLFFMKSKPNNFILSSFLFFLYIIINV